MMIARTRTPSGGSSKADSLKSESWGMASFMVAVFRVNDCVRVVAGRWNRPDLMALSATGAN